MLLGRCVVDQSLHGLTDRVVVQRDAVGGELGTRRRDVGALTHLGRDDARRDADRRSAGRDWLDDDCVTADFGAIADQKTAEHLGAGAHDDVAAQRRVALFALVERCTAQCDALVNRAAVADLGCFTNDDAHRVVKKHPLADFGAGMNFNAGKPSRQVRDKAPQPLETVVPAPVRAAVQQQCVKARVAGEHFPGRARGGVTVENALDVGSDSGKHAASL